MSDALPYETDGGAGTRGRFGLIVLSTDETLEVEARAVLHRPGLALYHARIPAHALVTPDTLRLMEAQLPDTAGRLPAGLDAIGYACTSGATVIGPDRVRELVQSRHPATPVTNPITAVIAALQALNARRIALVTPYVAEVNAPIRAILRDHGIDTITVRSFEQKEDWTVARISEASTLAALTQAGQSGADAIFASCTNLRSFGILDEAERATGLPVVTSNQALLWHMSKVTGVTADNGGPGRLFAL
ncbi:Asp/Glu/Hydantoin racemase family protein [Roseibacterium elongatum DSM 19469]|uniref:Asp/Glu/Hydantoin racemase family protein n=1 Tax=Roseicyclus elongatus DSM 19469 TaxID=1294273 RepID=W8SKY6_9RHOB|nr:aspartate/glutamate racemase family protein [Roseibacterium elongatum]AHM03200.1 Asp/Glu/Hydantoin racemase family protein [Roseibacterium elongatum DSM 19469]